MSGRSRGPGLPVHFTSFSAPAADLSGLVALARRYDYQGLELRIGAGHGHAVEPGLDAAGRRRVREVITEHGLGLSCLGSGALLSRADDRRRHLATAMAAVDLAADCGAELVRVFAGPLVDDVSRSDAQRLLIASLRSVTAHAADRGVTVGLETHDDWSDPARLRTVMTEVDHPAVGIVWDVWHPGRSAGASIADAHRLLQPWIRHVHVHDGLLRLDRLEFRAMGEGDLDHREVFELLHAARYPGAVSGEWLDWEPAEIHLPRERAALRALEHAVLDRPTSTA